MCIRAGANTGATCIRTEMNSFKNLANTRKMIPQKYSPVFARVQIQAPHVFAQKLIPQDFFLHVLVLCRGVFFLECVFLKTEAAVMSHRSKVVRALLGTHSRQFSVNLCLASKGSLTDHLLGKTCH